MFKLISGLGNPGVNYVNTRHNAGFIFLDELEDTFTLDKRSNSFIATINNPQGHKVFLQKPQSFMNNSGEAVANIATYYNINVEDILIVHDDLDIQLGQYKLQQSKGPAIHNGINSIEQALGNEDFWRLRLGIDNRTVEQRKHMTGADYVLGKFTGSELEIFHEVILQARQELSL